MVSSTVGGGHGTSSRSTLHGRRLDPSTQPAARAERRGDAHGLDEGVRQGDVAGLLGEQHPVELGHARARPASSGTAMPSTPISASACQTAPTRSASAAPFARAGPALHLAVGPRGPHDLGRALLGEEVAHRVAERELVVGRGEPHRRGSPR